jgi:D-alanyl-D-alanine-carboxypeptidase/D-alanyl-D-alanine-endopeptidase
VTDALSLRGVWLGTLEAGAVRLRIQLRLDLTKSPPEGALDSLDQRALGIVCSEILAAGRSLSFKVPAVQGSFVGAIADEDANLIEGVWSQGPKALPLALARQANAIAPEPRAVDPALPPVAIDHLAAVLEADLAKAFEGGDLAPSTGAGLAVGAHRKGARVLAAYGAVKVDSVFEIGSIAKPFTGLLLAQLVAQGKVRLDEPVRDLLPVGTVTTPPSGAEMTLLDLSTHRSGLPRLPENLKPADMSDPYADYDHEALYAYVAARGLTRPEDAPFLYSNLGFGLLGAALAHRAGTTYEELLRRQITGPLAMAETTIALPPHLAARFAQGHDAAHRPAKPWRLNALAGAGGIRSTAADMVTFLEAQLHPERLSAAARETPEGETLAGAIAASHAIRGAVGEGKEICLGWVFDRDSGTFSHNGGTGGFSSFALFDPVEDYAVVVLANTSVRESDAFVERVGRHVAQRLLGEPAESLGPPAR